MYLLLWLLLPVAAASGWWFALHSGFAKPTRRSVVSPDYFKGLNYLVNEQPDKAIEVFTRLLADHPEMLEMHLAVGNLFRRRGEVERAIRIHQHLLDHPGLSDKNRICALLELGQDYFRAGLLDRAEQLLRELIQIDPLNRDALSLLQQMYERENDWRNAKEIASRVAACATDPDRNDIAPVIAHYHCELAETALARRDFAETRDNLNEALRIDSRCVRGSLVEGRYFSLQGAYRDALTAYERVLSQDAAFVGEIIEPVADCFYKQNQTHELVDYLRHLIRRYPSGRAALLTSQLLKQHHGDHDAAVFLANFLNRTPSLHGVLSLLDLNLARSNGESKDTFRLVKSVLERVLEEQAAYRCRLCGFSGKVLHWLCPSCKHWNSVRPVEIIRLDAKLQ